MSKAIFKFGPAAAIFAGRAGTIVATSFAGALPFALAVGALGMGIVVADRLLSSGDQSPQIPQKCK